MPRLKQPRTLDCKWCGTPFETDHPQRRYCSSRCSTKYSIWRQTKKGAATARLARERTRPCPCCGIPFTGTPNKLYCSKFCSDKQQRRGLVYDKQKRKEHHDKKTAINLLASPPCSICSKTTARKGHYKSRELPIELPEKTHLCSNHHVGYARFVRRNGYEGQNPEIIFTTYIVHLTYSSRGAASKDKDMAVLKGLLSGRILPGDYQCR